MHGAITKTLDYISGEPESFSTTTDGISEEHKYINLYMKVTWHILVYYY